MAEKVSQVVDFVEEFSVSGTGITVELDDSVNLTAANEVRNSFAPDGIDKAFLRVILDNQDYAYEMKHNGTALVKTATNIAIESTEIIKFYDVAENELTYKPTGTDNEYTFIGKPPQSGEGVALLPAFDGKTVRFSEAVVASLEVTYKYLADRWSLQSIYSGDILVVAQQDIEGTIGKATEDVNFEAEAAETQEYTLVVKDFCDDAEVSNALVYLNEVYIGDTDIDGTIFLGELIIGQEYFLRVTKTGYIDSNEDTLLNDSFIPES